MFRTVHEVGNEDKELTFLCVFIGQKTAVDEFPTKGIGDEYYDAFRSHVVGWVGDIDVDAVHDLFSSSGFTIMYSTAFAASHCFKPRVKCW